jgi:formyltetrahydrofolate deformylase
MSSSVTAILLLSCPDRKGLVAKVSEFLFRHGGNVLHADQHSDGGRFLQRLEFEVDGFALGRDEIGPAFAELAGQLDMEWSLQFSDARPSVAILVSRHGHCLYDLLGRWRLGELRCRKPLVISNHADLQGVEGEFGVDYHHLPVSDETRAGQEASILRLLEGQRADVIILARYMQVLSDGFVARYPNRILNIHHSFLPAFAGGRPYHKAHDRGVKIIGATAHYVTEELDEGPIIEQDVARVSHRDTVRDMVHKGRDLEKVVLARAVHLHLEGRVLVHGNKTVVFD